jgi:hypothetical protein
VAPARTIAAIGIACGLAGCHVSATFTCENSAQCGPDGTCEPNNLCSFPDPSCQTGARYGDYSGDLSGECVGDSVSVGFQFATSLTDELVGTHTVPIALAAPAAQEVTVDVEVTGGNADDLDFTLITPHVTFTPGETVANVEVAIVDDGVEEPDETVELRLVAAAGAVIGAGDHRITISAGPLPRVQFVLS